MPLTTKTYRCNNTQDFSLGDTHGQPGDAATINNPVQSLINYGQTGKPSLRSWGFLRFGERDTGTTASGLGIPPKAIIDSASLDYEAGTTEATVFNAQFSLLTPDGNWDAVGPYTTSQGYGYRTMHQDYYSGVNSLADFGFYIGSFGETITGPSTGSTVMFSASVASPTVFGQTWILTPTQSGAVHNAGVRLAGPNGTASPDYDIWIELWEQSGFLPTNMLAESDHQTFNTVVTSGLDTPTVFEFSGDNIYEFPPHVGNDIYLILFKGDKTSRLGGETLSIGANVSNPNAFIFPGCSGIVQDGFSRDIYPFSAMLPTPFKNNNSTVNVPAFGSILSISSPAHTADTPVTINGLGQLIQEWVDDENYDSNQPCCLVVGPGDAAAAVIKSIKQTSPTSGTTDPILTVTYRERHVNVT